MAISVSYYSGSYTYTPSSTSTVNNIRIYTAPYNPSNIASFHRIQSDYGRGDGFGHTIGGVSNLIKALENSRIFRYRGSVPNSNPNNYIGTDDTTNRLIFAVLGTPVKKGYLDAGGYDFAYNDLISLSDNNPYILALIAENYTNTTPASASISVTGLTKSGTMLPGKVSRYTDIHTRGTGEYNNIKSYIEENFRRNS